MRFILEAWPGGAGCVGLRKIPGVLGQGDTLDDLEANVCDARELFFANARQPPQPEARFGEIEVPA